MRVISAQQVPTLLVGKEENGGITLTKRYLGGMERQILLEPDEIVALHKYLTEWLKGKQETA